MSAESSIDEILAPVRQQAANLQELEEEAAELEERKRELTAQIAEGMTDGLDTSELSDERREIAQQLGDIQEAIPLAHAKLAESRQRVGAEAAERRILQIRRTSGSIGETRRLDQVAVEELEAQLVAAKAKVVERDHELAKMHVEALILSERFTFPMPPLPSVKERFPPKLKGRQYQEVRRLLSMTRDTLTAAILSVAGWDAIASKEAWFQAQRQHMEMSKRREAQRRTAQRSQVVDWLKNLLSDGPIRKGYVFDSAAAAESRGEIQLWQHRRFELEQAARSIGVEVVHPLIQVNTSTPGSRTKLQPDREVTMWALPNHCDSNQFYSRRRLHDRDAQAMQQVAEVAMAQANGRGAMRFGT